MQRSFNTQTQLFVSSSDINHPILRSFDDTEALLESSQIEALLSSMYSSRTGRPSYLLLTLFRKFCHLELGGDVPEASTLGRFWTQLVEHGLWEKLLSEINRQLEVKNIIMLRSLILKRFSIWMFNLCSNSRFHMLNIQ